VAALHSLLLTVGPSFHEWLAGIRQLPSLDRSSRIHNIAALRGGHILEAIPKSIFSYNFHLQQENRPLGEVESSIWREKARLELQDGTYLLYRERYFSGDFVLERNGTIVARASKPSALYNTFELELPDRRLVLRKLSVWSRSFGVFDGEKQIGSIYPLGAFTRRTNIDLPGDWPLPIRGFLFWLVLIIWKRQQAAS
jgi:hypothetical protein